MDQFAEKLFTALKKDDLKAFQCCMEENSCGALRLGRFPVLSVMYLYGCRRLLKAYEKQFLKHNSWQDVGEPVEIAAKFRRVAGKCLRLYLNETVSPAEMLLLQNKEGKLQHLYPQMHLTAPAKARLTSIYYIRWGLHAECLTDKVVLEKRPRTAAEKRKLLVCAVCLCLCVAIAATTPFVVNAFSPFIKGAGGVISVSRWLQMRFASQNVYSLESDVNVSAGFFRKEMNCTIYGNGHTVTVTGNSEIFGTVNGKMYDLNFVTSGAPVADTFAITAQAENVSVTATVNAARQTECGFFVNNNYGAIQKVNVSVSGNLTVTATLAEGEKAPSLNFGGVAAHNCYSNYNGRIYYAVVSDCATSFNNFNLAGGSGVDAAFGGVVGLNEAEVRSCTASGTIKSDTVDICGIVAENRYWILESVNNTDLEQTSNSDKWNPIVAGVVLHNYYVADHCVNNGKISAVHTGGGDVSACASGIAHENAYDKQNPYVQYCKNNGNVVATSDVGAAAAGICSSSAGNVAECENRGTVTSSSTSGVAEAAGIAGYSIGYVAKATNHGAVSATASSEASAGGLCRFSNGVVAECKNFGTVTSRSTDAIAEAAGAVTISYGKISETENSGNVFAQSNGEVHVGGISARAVSNLSQRYIVKCYSSAELHASGSVCYVGGILGYAPVLKDDNGQPYVASVKTCISNDKITVTGTAEGASAVGGIVGFVQEEPVYMVGSNDPVGYLTGEFQYNYFTGTFDKTSGNAYVGSIAGIFGKNIYDSVAEGGNTMRGNAYLQSEISAYGAVLETLEGNNFYVAVVDASVAAMTAEELANDVTYNGILSTFVN